VIAAPAKENPMSTTTRTALRLAPVVLAIPAALWLWSQTSVSADAPAPPPARAAADRVARGEYLVSSIGCADCHSPKVMTPQGPAEDPSRRLSGHPEGTVLDVPPTLTASWITAGSSDLTAWYGPWGISYTFNLTPDENTGIGSWSEDTFVQTLKTGRHMGVSRPILPPMPWYFYRNLTDEDLRSIYAYLRTIPPIHNRVPLPTPPEALAPAAAAGG
jgi:mono/diheme cytochrome c family protein